LSVTLRERRDPLHALILRCRSEGGLEGDLQKARRSLEPSFEAAAQHLRRRSWMGSSVSRQPIVAAADR
jgi:hypothetical protein